MPSALSEIQARGKQVPGGACGFWGACGAGISTGMYMSIITKSTPLAKEAWGLSNQMTGQALTAIGKNGGADSIDTMSESLLNWAKKWIEKTK